MPRWDVKFEYTGGTVEMVEYISANTPEAAVNVAMRLRLTPLLPKHYTVTPARARNWA